MATHNVTIENFQYDPRDLTIEPGDTVVWTNKDSMQHTATSEDGAPVTFDTGLLAQNGEGQHIFDTAKSGMEIPYLCLEHPGFMKGKIIVS